MKIDRQKFLSLALSMMGAGSLAAACTPPPPAAQPVGPNNVQNTQPTDETMPTDEGAMATTTECVAWNEMTGECDQQCVAWSETGCVEYAPVGYQCMAWDEMSGNCTSYAPMDQSGQCIAWDEMTGECAEWAPANEGY